MCLFTLHINFLIVNRFFTTHKGTHEILNISESIILKFNYVFWFIRSYSLNQRWFLSTVMHVKSVQHVDIKLIPFETCLIRNSILLYIDNFRKILLIIIINDSMSDSNYSSKFTVLVVVGLSSFQLLHQGFQNSFRYFRVALVARDI